MRGHEKALRGLAALRAAGADKGACSVTHSEQQELTADTGRITLMRTTFESSVGMVAISDRRRGASGANKTSSEDLDRVAGETVAIARASQPDEAYDIAEWQEPGVFTTGPSRPDREVMVGRLSEFLDTARSRYPTAIIEQAILRFANSTTHFANTNGVSFSVTSGLYGFHAMFTSKEGQKTSSFNGASFATRDLNHELISGGSVDRLLRESTEQVDSRPLSGRFVGDLILTPEVLADFIGSYVDTFLRDGALISGTSRLRDKLGERVTAPCLSLRDLPRCPELASHHFVTSDGYLAQDQVIIDQGILKTFLLSLYGSRKTGKPRAAAEGTSLIVDSGDRSYEDMIRGVDRGIVLGRFSGGNPGESGEFSGVAKNSYYVEEGVRRFPINETMVSSNLIDLFQGITSVSAERVNDGSAVLPWVHCTGVTISGK